MMSDRKDTGTDGCVNDEVAELPNTGAGSVAGLLVLHS